MSLLSHEFHCVSPTDTQSLAARLAHSVYHQFQTSERGVFIALEGDLGAGKTCFSQGFIRALLPQAQVKSPTYTLVESYPLNDTTLYHLDLYRIYDPEELEYLGLRDFFWHNICLIEWASKAEGWLPEPDLRIQLTPYEGYHRVLGVAHSFAGEAILSAVSAYQPS